MFIAKICQFKTNEMKEDEVCGGEMIALPYNPQLAMHLKEWGHRCNKCGYERAFPKRYPLLEFDKVPDETLD